MYVRVKREREIDRVSCRIDLDLGSTSMYVVCERCQAAVGVGCEEVEEEGAPQRGDVLVLRLWLNVEPVRLECVS